MPLSTISHPFLHSARPVDQEDMPIFNNVILLRLFF